MVEAPFTGNGAPGAEDIGFTTLYLAARILGTAGLCAGKITKVLKDLYSVELETEKVRTWFALVPDAIKRDQTLYRFIKTLSKDKLWALRYVAGAALGDGDVDGRLRVKDLRFFKAYITALAVLTSEIDACTIVHRTRDGRYSTSKNRLVAHLTRIKLWKVLAYLDEKDEVKCFLGGLLDAEGSLSPHFDRRNNRLLVQLALGNTDLELVDFVAKSLRDLGLKPYIYVKKTKPHIANGKVFVRRRPMYEVIAQIPFSKLAVLTKVGFRCEREAQLFAFLFFLAASPLDQRLSKFLEYWVKTNGKWKQIKSLELEQLKLVERPPRRWQRQRQRRIYVVCPCRKPGIFELSQEVIGGKTIVKIQIHHDEGACTVYLAEEEVRERSLVMCKKCGKPGYIYFTIHKFKEGERDYKYVKVRVKHNNGGGKTRDCHLMSLRLLETPNAEAGKASPDPYPAP